MDCKLSALITITIVTLIILLIMFYLRLITLKGWGYLRVVNLTLNKSFDGIVYILPSSNSTPYWKKNYGDRIFFYVYANLSLYRDSIASDFKRIKNAGYSFIVVVIPLADKSFQYYYPNLNLINELAYENGLKVMWAIFPKWYFGPEWDYLHVNSTVYVKLIELLNYLTTLNGTYRVAVWYGWSPQTVPLSTWCNPMMLRNFINSLPQQVRSKYVVWIDMPFDKYVNECGVINVINELNIPAVTEEYSTEGIRTWYNTFKKQYITTGIWNASSVEAWCSGFDKLINPVLNGSLKQGYEPRILIVWIYWDVNDGSGELYRALTPGGLANPLRCISHG